MSAPEELYVLCGDREERVVAEKISEGRFLLSFGDRTFEVDAACAGISWSLIVEGQQIDATVFEDGARSRHAAYWVSTGPEARRVEVLEPLAYLTTRGGPGRERDRTGVAVAYMPGRVVSFLVEQGDVVAPGQSVLVLEAMKMENEIAAEAPGIVSKIFVELGAAVEAGDALFEISPQEPSGL